MDATIYGVVIVNASLLVNMLRIALHVLLTSVLPLSKQNGNGNLLSLLENKL